MSNPGGVNQFQREAPYGAGKKLQQLTRQAPMSGAPTPAANAPQQAQRRAVRGQRTARPVAAPVAAPAAPPEVSYQAQIAEVWRQLSGYTEDPLVHDLAAKAAAQT